MLAHSLKMRYGESRVPLCSLEAIAIQELVVTAILSSQRIIWEGAKIPQPLHL